MRAFLLACLAVVIIGASGYYVLNSDQRAAGLAFSTDAARIDPVWSWRAVTTASPAQNCTPRRISQWFFVDFHDPSGESGLCSYSQ